MKKATQLGEKLTWSNLATSFDNRLIIVPVETSSKEALVNNNAWKENNGVQKF